MNKEENIFISKEFVECRMIRKYLREYSIKFNEKLKQEEVPKDLNFEIWQQSVVSRKRDLNDQIVYLSNFIGEFNSSPKDNLLKYSNLYKALKGAAEEENYEIELSHLPGASQIYGFR